MSNTKQTKSKFSARAQQVRDQLAANGTSITQWALSNKFSPNLVGEVLSGRRNPTRGQTHNIAVALGLKEGEINTGPAANALNAFNEIPRVMAGIETKSELAASAHMADGYRADVCLAHPVTGETLQPEIMHVIDLKTRLVGLLPCPFCGAQPVADVFEDEEDHFHFLSCENKACPANVCAVGNTGEEAAALWNTRNGGAA